VSESVCVKERERGRGEECEGLQSEIAVKQISLSEVKVNNCLPIFEQSSSF